jgi:hypothetical protein
MVEQQQQTTINWLNPADQSVLETTIAYEQVAIDLTAYFARNEPDPYVREAFNFGLLEDFDHLYRYSELLDYLEGKEADSILQGKTQVFLAGRPPSITTTPRCGCCATREEPGPAPQPDPHPDPILRGDPDLQLL